MIISTSSAMVATMEAATAHKAKFVGAKLIGTNMMETKFYNADFANATLEGDHAPYAIWEGVHMQNCHGCPVDW